MEIERAPEGRAAMSWALSDLARKGCIAMQAVNPCQTGTSMHGLSATCVYTYATICWSRAFKHHARQVTTPDQAFGGLVGLKPL